MDFIKRSPWGLWLLQPYMNINSSETEAFWKNEVKTMAADALALFVTSSNNEKKTTSSVTQLIMVSSGGLHVNLNISGVKT